MATTVTAYRNLTLVELAKRKAPDGSMAAIVDALAEENAILRDAIFIEANDTFSNKTTRRSDEPAGSWRKLNKGVQDEASKTTELTDTIGILETWAQNDVELINAFPNPRQARSDEAMSFVKGLGKTMAYTMIYGDASQYPERFTGLAPRLDATTDTMVATCSGSGSDVTSLYIVTWGKDKCHMVYPKGSRVGLEHKDKGIQIVTDSSGYKYDAYIDKFTWKAGMVVRDPRAIGRVANIETSGTSNIFDEDKLIDVLVQMNTGPGTVIYCNRTSWAQMWKRLKDKNNVHFSRGEGLDAGGPPLTFDGIPIRRVDQIVNTETAIS